MVEFKVNKFITLKLEGEKTNIYVNNRLFNQCKYILTRRKIYELEDLLEIDSIDELKDESIDKIAGKLDYSLENIEPGFIDNYLNRNSEKEILIPIYLYSSQLSAYMKLIHYIDCREGDNLKLKKACNEIISLLIE